MERKKMELIRFDWAMKRILRAKANFVVLEGFLSVLLKEKITIEAILSSQANQEAEDEKYNDVFAYPNPVRSNYPGTVFVRGLIDNSIVKKLNRS